MPCCAAPEGHRSGRRFMAAPHPSQTWSHATNSAAQLRIALGGGDGSAVSAIEADVRVDPGSGVPVMAHDPVGPRSLVDLTLEAFLDACAAHARPLHVKLDFKEARAVRLGLPLLAPRLAAFQKKGACVWLNADVLPGPGRRREPEGGGEGTHGPGLELVDASEFVNLGLALDPVPAFSLGWRCGLSSSDRYTMADMSAMQLLLERTGLLGQGFHADDMRNGPGASVVLAVWVRMALRDPKPLLELARALPTTQLLVWSASGDLPLSSQRALTVYTQLRPIASRVGYDLLVAKSRSCGPTYDFAEDAYEVIFF